MSNNGTSRWLVVDSTPLSQAVLRTLEALDGVATWSIYEASRGFPCNALIPEYCLCLAENDNFVLDLLRNNIRAYGLPRRNPLIVWLLDPEAAGPAVFTHLSPAAARRVLHKWKNRAFPNMPLATVVRDVLLPLERLGYLATGDSKYLQTYADPKREIKHRLVAREIEGRILPELRFY